MRIAVVGAGYVGLVSGACFSEFGVEVRLVDSDSGRIERLRSGEMPIYEPGLSALVARNVAARRLSFTGDLGRALKGVEAVFIAVGTPSRRGDGHADLSYVLAAAEEIGRALEDYAVVVTKSTVPVGTGRKLSSLLERVRPHASFDIAANPEFLREGSAIEDFMRPDRVVIGTESERARAVLQALYRPLYLIETPILFTDLETAELIKYAANAFLATKITFINEISDLCERLGGDIQDVARGIGLDGRIGRKFLHVGPGFGGSCFPKDCRALLASASAAGTDLKIVAAALAVNEGRKKRMAEKILDACGGTLAGKRLAVLGLTFKPNTDDLREAPSLEILPRLLAAGAEIRAYDPEGMDEAKELIPDLVTSPDPYAAMEGASALVLLTEWNAFRALDLARVRRLLAVPLVIDLRNIYKPEELRAAGLSYVSLGRPPSLAVEEVRA